MSDVGMAVEVRLGETFATKGSFQPVRAEVLLEGEVEEGETYESACKRIYMKARLIMLDQAETMMFESMERQVMVGESGDAGWKGWFSKQRKKYEQEAVK